MKNNKPENETTNQQNDSQQTQLVDLPVEEAQETEVRGGVDLTASTNTNPRQVSSHDFHGRFASQIFQVSALTDEAKRKASNE